MEWQKKKQFHPKHTASTPTSPLLLPSPIQPPSSAATAGLLSPFHNLLLPANNNYAAAPPLPPPPQPPPPPQTHSISFYYPNQNAYPNYANSAPNRLHYQPFYHPQPSMLPAATRASASTPPPYVDHQAAKKIRNYVNVHKDTLRLEVDQENPDHHLISFVFDAVYDGR